MKNKDYKDETSNDCKEYHGEIFNSEENQNDSFFNNYARKFKYPKPKLNYKFYLSIVAFILSLIGTIIYCFFCVVREYDKANNVYYEYSNFDAFFKDVVNVKKYVDSEYVETFKKNMFFIGNYIPILLTVYSLIIIIIKCFLYKKEKQLANNEESETNFNLYKKRNNNYSTGNFISFLIIVLFFILFMISFSFWTKKTRVIQDADIFCQNSLISKIFIVLSLIVNMSSHISKKY